MRRAGSPAEAVVCVGDAGINGLATVRSLGRRGGRAHVVALQARPQIASLGRYCAGETSARFAAVAAGLWCML